ncbi:MAG: S-layer homology domain-containing protein [Chloroflexota bacterium]
MKKTPPRMRLFSFLVLVVMTLTMVPPPLSAVARAQEPAPALDGPQPITIQPVKVGISQPYKSSALALAEMAPQVSLPTGNQVGAMPAPIVYPGLSNQDNLSPVGTGLLVNPPDTNGDIGPGHYVQVVNNLFKVINPSGSVLELYRRISSLFAGFGGLCETNDEGSPIVLYDHLADRWIISQMARDITAPSFEYHQCIAVSVTPDPVSDLWYLYDYQIVTNNADLYTSPKMAVWANGYYLTVDQWKYNSSLGTWSAAGQGAAVFERPRMLVGQNARMIYFDLFLSNPELSRMIPADLDGFPPPADTPGFFLQIDDDGRGAPADQVRIWQMDVNWNNEFAAWGEAKNLAVSSFDSKFACNTTTYTYDCIPQQGATTSQYLDVLSDRLMYRAQYRYLDGDGHLILNHTVDTGADRAGVRWYHLQTNDLDEWSVADQGTHTYADTVHRWMGSAAMDASGNIAVGYSASGSLNKPSIRYAGRLAADTPGQLAQGEATIWAGTGIQTDENSRWGNYSSLVVDPLDQCTFWYTNEYYDNGGGATDWKTSIAKFNFGTGTCTTPATSTIGGTVYDALTNQPIVGALVTTDTGFAAVTGADGIYTLKYMPSVQMSLTATATEHNPATTTATPPATSVDFYLTLSEDNFDGSLEMLTIPYQHTADTTIASVSEDDPEVTNCGLGQGSATLWFEYNPTDNRFVYLDTLGSNYDTFLAVWTGSPGDFTPVVCNDDSSDTNKQSALSFAAESGVTYYIETGQSNDVAPTGGDLVFNATTFSDVKGNYWAWRFVEGLYNVQVTGGCSTNPVKYCPDTFVTREQMAVFLLRAKNGPSYLPPPVGSSTGFTDVPINSPFAPWIKELAAQGITGGCGGTNYCPKKTVTREQMAVFLLRTKFGQTFVPDPAVGVFADVPVEGNGFAPWIERLAADGITGGCGGDNYCPKSGVTRAQMAVFLDKTFDIPLLP